MCSLKIVTVMFDLEEPENPHLFSHERTVEKILDVLKSRDVKAVFNTTGVIAEQYPNVIESLYSNGHEIANHSYGHEDFTQLTYDEVFESIQKTENMFEDIIDEKPVGFRSPRLAHDDRLYPLLVKMGYKWTSNKYHWFREAAELDNQQGFVPKTWSWLSWKIYPKKPYMNKGILEIPLFSSMDGEFLGWLPPSQNSSAKRIDYAVSSYLKQYKRSDVFFNLNFHPWLIGTGNRIQVLSKILDNLIQQGGLFQLARDITV